MVHFLNWIVRHKKEKTLDSVKLCQVLPDSILSHLFSDLFRVCINLFVHTFDRFLRNNNGTHIIINAKTLEIICYSVELLTLYEKCFLVSEFVSQMTVAGATSARLAICRPTFPFKQYCWLEIFPESLLEDGNIARPWKYWKVRMFPRMAKFPATSLLFFKGR